MISRLTTNQKAEVWVNLDQIIQMTTITVEDGYPSTEIIMANGASINVYEKPSRYSERGQRPVRTWGRPTRKYLSVPQASRQSRNRVVNAAEFRYRESQ